MRTRFAALVGVFASAAGVLVAAGGCEAIVGSNVSGNVQCLAVVGVDAGDLCPKGQSCIGGTCKPTPSCVGAQCFPRDSGFDAPRDTGVDHDATVMRDVIVDTTPPVDAGDVTEAATLSPLGAMCSSGSGCQTGLCGTSTLLTSNVMTPKGASVCTKPCCTSSDCDDPTVRGFVCYPSVGGNYCVDPHWISLPTVSGLGAPGTPCMTGATQCRSGVCTGGKCQDTCCLDTDCMNNTVCQESVLDGVPSFNCGRSGGTVTQGDTCGFVDSCQSNYCFGLTPFYYGYCLGACCQDSDCKDPAGSGTNSCNLMEVTVDGGGAAVLRSCSQEINPGAGAYQSMCSKSSDCTSGLCYQKSKCTAPCCVDTDCSGGWVCRSSAFTSPFTFDLLVCVPPS
jgi:hypothetical protein